MKKIEKKIEDILISLEKGEIFIGEAKEKIMKIINKKENTILNPPPYKIRRIIADGTQGMRRGE